MKKAPPELHTTNAGAAVSRETPAAEPQPRSMTSDGALRTLLLWAVAVVAARLPRWVESCKVLSANIGEPVRHRTESHRYRYRIDRSTWLALAVMALLLAVWPAPARASYRPAPRAIVLAALSPYPPPRGTAAKRAWVACRVWGRRHCVATLNVAWCESSLRPWASNGQYKGIWQMGSGERARFGHGPTVWQQAPAAHRYWLLAGWRPWSCHP